MQRRQFRFDGLGIRRRVFLARHVDRAGDAVLGGQLQKLGEDLAHLLLGYCAGEQRHGLAADESDHHRDRLRAESLRQLRIGVDIDLGEDKPTAEFE